MPADSQDPNATTRAPLPWVLLKRTSAAHYEGARTLCRALDQSEEVTGLDRDGRKQLLKLLIALERHTTLLARVSHDPDRPGAIDPRHLLKLFRHRRHWIRDPRDFLQCDHAPKDQLQALIRHLFVRYPTAPFILRAYEGTEADRRVFFHIAQGGNIRTLKGFEPALTKAQAHLFHNFTDPELELRGAALLAVALSHGLPDDIAHVLARNPCVRQGPFAFWNAFMEFLGRQVDVGITTIGALVDYLHHHRELPPERPGQPPRAFSFKHRSLAGLLELSDRWHAEIASRPARQNRTWEPTSWFSQLPLDANGHGWQIYEILTERELNKEGHRMRHCVYTYLHQCLRHKSRIFTLVRISPEHPQGWHCLTVEVIPRQYENQYEILQARGKKNRNPTREEDLVLSGWARANRILTRDFTQQ